MSQPSDRFNARAFQPIEPGTPVLLVTCPVLADTLFRGTLKEDFMTYAGCHLAVLRAFRANKVHGIITGTARDAGPTSSDGKLFRLNAEPGGAPPLLETGAALEAAGAELLKSNGWPERSVEKDLAMTFAGIEDRGTDFVRRHPWIVLACDSFEMFVGLVVQDTPETRAMALSLASLLLEDEEPPTDSPAEADDSPKGAPLITDGDPGVASFVRRDGLEARAWDSDEAFDELRRQAAAQEPAYDRLQLAYPDTPENRTHLTLTFEMVLAHLRERGAAVKRNRPTF